MKIKIAIADDHPLVINGLQHILGNCVDMEIIGSYPSGKELLVDLVTKQPDVLLLDISMPGQTGDELAEIISEKYPDVKMLALTNLDNVYYIKNMLRKGVHGYILKTSREEILLTAIRAVHNGEQFLEPILKEKVVHDALLAKRQVAANPILSRREKEVLQFIASNLTSQQIADKLFVSKRTIDNHRLSLLMKLDAKNVAALVKKGIQMGLIE
ncbi:MAG: response regulator containing a CheY-like receiver domain and an DNA-binding domain [Flavipsychrobacter sp.]|nr:response regulator containing a CheY-like receiver domain and an DNA-binding domain [Flavipsychrobacter sp.]